MKLNKEFPELEQFLGGYFHQDWKDFHGSAEMAIEEYAINSSKDELSHTVQELDRLLSLGLSEAELDYAICKELGCYYNPKPRGRSMTEWLRWVRATLIKYEQLATKGQ